MVNRGNQRVDIALGIVRCKRGAQCTTHAKRCQQRLGTVLPGTQRNAISCQQGHHVAMVYARKIKGYQA